MFFSSSCHLSLYRLSQLIKIHMKDYGAKKLQYANDIALAELDTEVDVTSWTLPVCMDWGLELPDLRHGQEGTVG